MEAENIASLVGLEIDFNTSENDIKHAPGAAW